MSGFGAQRPNQTSAVTAAANQGRPCANAAPCVSWLSAGSFAQASLGTLGNLGVLNIAGPGNFQEDISLSREFRLWEREMLEIRGEAFNLANHPRFNNPAATLNTSSTFG